MARDESLGIDGPSIKAQRDAEDSACNVGLINPAVVCKRWPKLVEAMRPVREALLKAIQNNEEPKDQPLCTGAKPAKSPPSA